MRAVKNVGSAGLFEVFYIFIIVDVRTGSGYLKSDPFANR